MIFLEESVIDSSLFTFCPDHHLFYIQLFELVFRDKLGYSVNCEETIQDTKSIFFTFYQISLLVIVIKISADFSMLTCKT